MQLPQTTQKIPRGLLEQEPVNQTNHPLLEGHQRYLSWSVLVLQSQSSLEQPQSQWQRELRHQKCWEQGQLQNQSSLWMIQRLMVQQELEIQSQNQKWPEEPQNQ